MSNTSNKQAQKTFDVFLCHNHHDKPQVKLVGEQLEAHGLAPWLDEWELPPGIPWQRLLEEQILQVRSAAVFVGKSGIGPWHRMEIEAFLQEFVRRQCPVIPVILADAPKVPKLPPFLALNTWVDFRDPDQAYALHKLVSGIKGVPPGRWPPK